MSFNSVEILLNDEYKIRALTAPEKLSITGIHFMNTGMNSASSSVIWAGRVNTEAP